MVLNILTSPDAMDSIQLGVVPVLAFVGIIFTFIIFEVLLIKKLLKMSFEKKKILNSKLNKMIILPIFLIILIEKISYGVSSLLNKNEIMLQFKVIPLYQPLTFNRIAAKYFDYKPDVQVKNTIKVKGNLNYPLNKIALNDKPNKFNIFIIASDSVRRSIITPEVAPNISKFEKDSIIFKNHHSGGNATRFGIFSLMYGINSTYWFSFLNNAKGSVLFDVLKDLDYQIDIVSSTNTNWPEFRKTCYVNVLDSIKDDFKGSPWKKDKQSSEYFINNIETLDKEKPIFSFIFLDAPHGYSFPKNHNKFNANSDNINYLTAAKGTKDIKNVLARYKNSVHYNDMLFGQMIDKLKEEGLYENSMIIYTSDHGSEFYENGFFGHNSAFTRYQTSVPFIVKFPKNMQNIEFANLDGLTSHNDVVPSLLSLIGVTNKPTDYSNGGNIFNKEFKRNFAFCANWNNNAILTDDKIYVFSNLPNKMFSNEVRDSSTYEKVLNGEKVNSKLVLDIMNENKTFLK